MPKTKRWLWCFEKQGEGELHLHSLISTLFMGKTPFQEVGIVETERYGKMLMLGGDVQSAQLDEFIYHEALVQPAMILHPQPRKVLIFGGGEGATLREVVSHSGVEKVVMVDIDGQLVELVKKYLPEWSRGAFADPRAEIVIADAREWLFSSREKFDLIISDLTEPLPDSPSYQLFTREFFLELKSHLSNNGVFVLQASVADLSNFELHCRIVATLKEVFAKVFPFSARMASFDVCWGFALASDTLDPFLLTPAEVNNRINQRISRELSFYDGITHMHLFNLPKTHRDALLKYQKPLRKEVLEIAQALGEAV